MRTILAIIIVLSLAGVASAETLVGRCTAGADQAAIYIGSDTVTAVPATDGAFAATVAKPTAAYLSVEVACHYPAKGAMPAGWSTSAPFVWIPDGAPTGVRIRP